MEPLHLDPEQTREFVHQLTSHQAALRAFIVSQMPGSPGVGDVLQQVNLLLWEKMAKFEPGSDFRAWAVTVARYKIMEHRRQLKRDGWLVFDDELAASLAAEVTQDDDGQAERYLQALDGCMGKLTGDDRQLIQQRYNSSGTIKDFADQRGLDAGNLRVALHRLRMALRACILSTLSNDDPLTSR